MIRLPQTIYKDSERRLVLDVVFNSLIVSIGTALLGLFIAIPAGYAFSRYKFTGRNASMFSFLLVQMFPGIIILVPYFLVMKTLGLLNSHLGLILAYCVTALPLCVWMLKGFFDTIPRELEEAAELDGCNQFQVFTKVVLPLSTPAIAVTALFSFLAAWNEFLLALTFNTSNDMYTLPVGLASLISSTGQAWGDFAAASLLVSLPVALLFLFFQKFLIDGLSAGGVKGENMVSVKFEQVNKRYDDGFQAVRNLNLEIKDKEFLVLLGPSGCGKSTTLRMLAGLEDVTEGSILIDGMKINHLPAGARGLGMVFQSYALYPHMTIRGNLAFGLRMMKGTEKLADGNHC